MASKIFGRRQRSDPEAGLVGAARIVELALWLSWTTLILRSVGADYQFIRSPARLLSEFGAVLIILTSLYWALKLRPQDGRARARRWALIMLAVCMAPAVYGLVRGNYIVGWAFAGFFPYMTAAGIVLGAQPTIMVRLERVLFWQVVLGVVFAVYVLTFHPPHSRGEWNGLTGLGLGKHATRTLAATAFLLPFIHRMKTWRAMVVVLALGLYITLAIAGMGRSLFFTGAVLFPVGLLLIHMTTRRRWFNPVMRATLLTAVIVLIGLISTNRLLVFERYFSHQWEGTASRLTGGDAEGSLSEVGAATLETSTTEFSAGYSRGAELKSFLEQLEAIDFVAGRGFGGTWYSSFWRTEWGMVHIGPGHLILQGGIPLLVAFMLVFTLAIISAWKQRSSDHVAGALLYLLAFMQSFLKHGAIQDEYEVYLAWLCVGMALAAGANARGAKPARSKAAHAQVSSHLLHGVRR